MFIDYSGSISMSENKLIIDHLGGRKAMAFYAALGCSFVLALSGKASGETLGLIDTLYLVFAGANVAAKRTNNIQNKIEVQK